jgi:DNA polymerase-3 subunit gamma/tau
MLSTGAWNALLKILEEPPPYVVFMFATTEINKVPATIISRVQKFMLRKITLDELMTRLAQICESEGIEADRAALEIVARRGEGSVRDALSLLDQIIAFSGRTVSAADVASILGLSDTAFFARIVSLIGEGDHAAILEALQEATDGGRDFKMLYRDLLSFVRNLMLLAGGAPIAMLAASPEDLTLLQSTAKQFSYTDLLRIANLLLRDDETVNRAEHQRLAVELALLKAATFPRLKSVEQALSGQVSGGSASPPVRPAATRKSEAQGVTDAGGSPRAAERPVGRAPGNERQAVAPARQESSPSGELDSFVQRVQKARPPIGGYLAGAKSSSRNGNRITFLFADDFYADAVAEAKQSLEDLASEVFGERITIDVQTESTKGSPNRRAEDGTAALRDDPVVQAFARHLGGEVVESRKR